jgi:hypothetical protein
MSQRAAQPTPSSEHARVAIEYGPITRELAHRIPPILATAALFALPPDARAQPSPAQLAEARQRFEVGVQAFDGGDYETAAAEFRRAWELTQHPDLLYNI